MTSTVLITGATGFAGSHLVEQYAARGWVVHGTYRDAIADSSWIPPGVILHRIGLADHGAVNDLVQTVPCSLVLHLAAQSSVSASWQDPMGTLTENAGAQHALLEALARYRREARVLVVGSCDEYGSVPPDRNPIREDSPLLPANPYALSKVVQDLMGYQYFERYGMPVIRVRPFLQLGPRRQSRFAAGSFARQIAEIGLGRRPPVLEVGNIDLARDFTDVRDVAAAYALAAERGEPGEVYNIAAGRARTLRDLLQSMLDIAGVTAEIRTDPRREREGEAPLLVGDATRLHARTGWRPVISFEQSAADTLRYWQDRLHSAVPSPGGSLS